MIVREILDVRPVQLTAMCLLYRFDFFNDYKDTMSFLRRYWETNPDGHAAKVAKALVRAYDHHRGVKTATEWGLLGRKVRGEGRSVVDGSPPVWGFYDTDSRPDVDLAVRPNQASADCPQCGMTMDDGNPPVRAEIGSGCRHDPWMEGIHWIRDTRSRCPQCRALLNITVTDSAPRLMSVVRVCNNGDRKGFEMSTEDALHEVAYSRQCRGGTAQFLDGECVQLGYLGAERCAAISEELKSKINLRK